MRIYSLDKKLSSEVDQYHKDKRRQQEAEHFEIQDKYFKIIEDRSLFTKEDIKEYFTELNDILIDEINFTFEINPGYVDDKIYIKKTFKNLKTSYIDDRHKNTYKIPKGTIIYSVRYTIYLPQEDGVQYEGGTPVIFDKIDKFISNDLSLPTDLKILHSNPQYREDYYPGYTYEIILQQL